MVIIQWAMFTYLNNVVTDKDKTTSKAPRYFQGSAIIDNAIMNVLIYKYISAYLISSLGESPRSRMTELEA